MPFAGEGEEMVGGRCGWRDWVSRREWVGDRVSWRYFGECEARRDLAVVRYEVMEGRGGGVLVVDGGDDGVWEAFG